MSFFTDRNSKALFLIPSLFTEAQRKACPYDAVRVLKDKEPPLYFVPGFILKLKKDAATLIEFIGAVDHSNFHCLNKSVGPPQLVLKRLTDIEEAVAPQKKELIGSDIEERNVWIQKLVSKSEEAAAEVSTANEGQAAKTRERQQALASKKAMVAARGKPSDPKPKANPNGNAGKKRKRAEEKDPAVPSPEDSGEETGPPSKRSKSDTDAFHSARTSSNKKRDPVSKKNPSMNQFLDFHGTKMSGVTFMLTPDLAKSGATVTFTLGNSGATEPTPH